MVSAAQRRVVAVLAGALLPEGQGPVADSDAVEMVARASSVFLCKVFLHRMGVAKKKFPVAAAVLEALDAMLTALHEHSDAVLEFLDQDPVRPMSRSTRNTIKHTDSNQTR